jgi:RimJ/RimL family protein N-acetyltransferase
MPSLGEISMPDAVYPAELEHDLVGPDGTQFRLRPIRRDDAERLVALHSRLSEQTVYQRFFTVMRRLPTNWARYLADVDYRGRLALVVERQGPDGPELVGVGRYEPTREPGRVEVAFVIEDRWQRMGLGTALFNDLLGAAEARGIQEFAAEVLAENTRMLDLIRRFGDVVSSRLDHAVVSLVFKRRTARRSTRSAAPAHRSARVVAAADC